MALVVKDRVKETTTTTGTGTINLAGAATGFQTFVAAIGTTNTTFYAITDANGSAWEVGIGTVTDASPDTLARTTLLASSTGSKIALTTGTHTVFATYPAGKAVYLDASGGLSHTVDLTSEVTGILPTSNGGTGTTGGIALGTSTTGDYVKNLIAGSLITLPVTEENSGETATPTIAVRLAAAATATPVDGDYMLFLDGGIGSCNDASYTTQATCEAAGTCSNGAYTTQSACEAATETWTAKVWTAADGTPAKGSLADIATLFAGDGLTASQSVLAVNVDDSTIEIATDALQVKDDGITLAKMAGITRGSIIYGDAGGNPAYFAVGSANTVFQTVDGTDVSWNTVATDMIADNAVTLAKMAGITRGAIIKGDASGDPAYLAVGAAKTFLRSGGTDASWGTISIDDLGGLARGSLITGDDSDGSCNDATYTDQTSCEAAGTCSNVSYTNQSTCEAAEATWTAKIWTATLTELTIGAADTALTSDGTDPSWAKISNAMLANDSVSYGGVEVDLGASDATPAFNLIHATGLPIIDGTTGTLSVARGGTGQTTLDNLITLGGHTTGSYVSTLTGGTGITSTGATTGETIAHSISTDASQTHVTGLGTITTGVWQGTTIAVGYGGTGATTLNNLITLGTHTTGDYAATITAGTGLTSTGATSGESIAHGLSVDASQTQITALGTIGTGVWEATKIEVEFGGTNATSFANKAVVITQDSGDDTLAAAAMTSSGGLLIGGASGPAVATLTAGDNVTITNADGAITIASEPAATETIEDIAGALVAAGTKTGITVEYKDAESAISMVVNQDLDDYDNTVSQFVKRSDTEIMEDMAGPLIATGGTKTGITVTYQDGTGDIDMVVADTTFSGDTGTVALTPGAEAFTIAGGTNVTTALTTSSPSTLTINAVDTTYSSGDGLDLSSTTFALDLKANSGAVISGGELSIDLGASAITGALGTDNIGDNQVTTGKMAGIARGGCIVGDENGDPSVLSPGTENQVLTIDENGDTKWEDPASGTHHDHYTAGDGLVLAGSEFATDLKANGGLVIESEKLAVDLGASSITGILVVKDGGTGVATLTDGGLLLGSGTGPVTVMAVLADGAIVIGDGSGDPVALSAFSSSTGTLKIANGGTGATTLDNLIALGGHTTGNYVATLTGGTGITSTGATSGETIVHSISTDASQTHVTGLGTITTGVWNATKIAGAYIADDAIDSQHYVDGSIDNAHIADDAIDSEHYVNGSIDTAHIGDLQVTTGKIAADAITGAKIVDNAINSEHYYALSIDTEHIANLQVTTGKIAADAVDGTKLADNAVDSEHYTDGSIDTAHIGADQITSALIADDQIDSEHIVDGSIDLAHMSAESVDSDQYVDGSIDLIHLSADSVDGTKIVDDAIDSEHYTDGSIDFIHIQDVAANSILGRNANSSGVLSEIALTTTQILIGDGTGFTAAALSGDVTMTNAGLITIGDDKIDSQHYVDDSIDTAHIADDQVTLAKMADLARGKIIVGNSSGDPAALAAGTEDYVLTMNSSGDAVWASASGGGGSGDITAVVAGTGLSGGATSGSATLNVEAAQPGITSVGTLTTLTVDSIIINGTTIGHTSDTDAMAISSDGNVTFSKATKPSLKANSDASTVTFDVNEANVHTVTLGANRTFAISNETAGQKFMIRVLQDGTGSRLVSTWFSTIKWAGGSAPTLTTTAGKADVFGFLVTGTDTYDGFVIGQNI